MATASPTADGHREGAEGCRVIGSGYERWATYVIQRYTCHCCCLQVELSAAADVESVQAQLQAHFRSRNVVYALLVEGKLCHLHLHPQLLCAPQTYCAVHQNKLVACCNCCQVSTYESNPALRRRLCVAKIMLVHSSYLVTSHRRPANC
jgi:hypothetical protein